MKDLSYKTIQNTGDFVLRKGTERFLQFGEGNFLRGFVDYFIDKMNESLKTDDKVVVIQPLPQGLADTLNKQDGLYRVYLRGIVGGKPTVQKRLISAISRAINPYTDFDAFLKNAQNPDLRFIVSNTTEAGISCLAEDQFTDCPPSSFPGKLTRFLWERYQMFGDLPGKGFVILSCELIADNGRELQRCVMEYARRWNLPKAFLAWIDRENLFCSTLVDRIITGYPSGDADAINSENGDIDRLIDTGEPFALWAIEAPETLKKELPFAKANLPVQIVPDQSPYKKRKVRILNGAQTGISLPAFLMGYDISLDYMADLKCVAYVRHMIYREIIPHLHMDEWDLIQFADEVMIRLNNPYIRHRLLDISLNSVSKWQARNLPSIKAYYADTDELPTELVFSLAALLEFYRIQEKTPEGYFGYRDEFRYPIRDNKDVLEFFWNHRSDTAEQLVHAALTSEVLMGENLAEALPGIEKMITGFLTEIHSCGVRETLYRLVEK